MRPCPPTARLLAAHLSRLGCALLLLAAAACGTPGSAPTSRDPSLIRVGVLPDQSRPELLRRYEPLMEFLSDTVGREVQLLVPESYAALVDGFVRGDYELAWFGGLTFTQAEARCEAVPLVLRDVDLEFTSDYLVSSAVSGDRLEDLAGRSLAFGPQLSTSGHLMPRYFLQKAGIQPDAFFASVRHSASHDETASWVQQGLVDVGVANSVVVESMFSDGRLDPVRVRILARTPPYRNYVWAVPRDLSRSLQNDLRDAFLSLEHARPEHRDMLKSLGTKGFLPASRNHYVELREAARILDPKTPEAGR